MWVIAALPDWVPKVVWNKIIVFLMYNKKNIKYIYIYLYIYEWFACMCVWCQKMSEEGCGPLDGFELSCGCWELDLHPLQEQLVLLTFEPPPEPKKG